MTHTNPMYLFDDVADTLINHLAWYPELYGGKNPKRMLRYILRGVANFCRLSYDDCRIEVRINNLEPSYCSPEQFVATMKECFSWSDEKCEEIFQILNRSV